MFLEGKQVVAKSRRRRRGRGIIRAVLIGLAISWMATVLASGGHHGAMAGHSGALFVAPMAFFGMIMAVPFVLLALLVAAGVMLLPLAILASLFGWPLVLLYRFTSLGRNNARAPVAKGLDTVAVAPPADALLRRRYVAGELSYDQFQAAMLDLLKGRYARGEIVLFEYERELDRLLAPARRLDVKRDPALADPFGETAPPR